MSLINLKSQISKLKTQKGVSILLTILIMSVILAIGLGISFILMQQIKMMRETGYSVIVFYAADTGIEEILMMAEPTNIPETPLPNGAKYEVSVKTPGIDCDALSYCIKSVGTYKETRRAIEIKF